MNFSKSIFSLIFLTFFIGMFSVNAQIYNEGVAALTKIRVPQEAKNLLINHLKAVKEKGKVTTQDLQNFKASSTLGFNIGMPPNKEIIYMVFPSRSIIKRAQRLPYDALGVSAELGAALRKQGINTSKSMVFIVNTKTKSIQKFHGPSGTGKTIK